MASSPTGDSPAAARPPSSTSDKGRQTPLRRCLCHWDMLFRVDAELEAPLAEVEEVVTLLDTIPGISRHIVQMIVTEPGTNGERFPSPCHLASWAGLCPGLNESAGKHYSSRTRILASDTGQSRTWCRPRQRYLLVGSVSASCGAAWSFSLIPC